MAGKTKIPDSANIVFSGDSAAKLVAGLTETKIANLTTIFAKKAEISKIRLEDVEKMAKLINANIANGSCGFGCF